MRFISVREPWATAIICLGKDVENRVWHPTENAILPGQRLGIHASLKIDMEALPEVAELAGISVYQLRGMLQPGKLIGHVRYVGWGRNSKSKWAQPDQFHILLANPLKFKKPMLFRGQLGIFSIGESVLKQVGYKFS